MKKGIKARRWIWIPLLLAAVAIMISMKNGSIWPDEELTYRLIKRTFPNFVKSFRTLSARTAQCGMIFYMFIEWAWVQLFGLSELGMRSSNIVLVIPYFVYAVKTLRKLNLSPWYMILFALNSLLVFYLNDARPYVMVMSCGMMFFYYAMLEDLNSTRTLAKLHLAFFLGMGAHMMFLFAFFTYLTRCVYMLKNRALDVKKQIKVLLCYVPLYLPLALYYMYVFAHASELDESIGSLICVGEVLYFLAGFAGLGMNRIQLREMHWDALTGQHIFLISCMMVAYIGMLAYIARRYFQRKKEQEKSDVSQLTLIFISMMVALGLFMIVNIACQTRFWERHCIWMVPFVLTVTCLLLDKMLKSRLRWAQAAAALMIVMHLVSSGMVVWSPYHAKDDYKGIVEYFNAKDDEHYTLLFQGKRTVFSYYGWTGVNRDGSVESMSEASGEKIDITNLKKKKFRKCLEEYPDTYYLILSEKARFDRYGLYDLYEGDCSFPGFKIVRLEAGAKAE